MSSEALFALVNGLALPGWAILILAPRRPWLLAVPGFAIPLALALLYAVLVMRDFGGAEGGFGSLPELQRLFANRSVLLAGWIHYLAFDLIVGALVAVRMDRAGINRLVQAPVLLTVFLLGPLGFLLALLIEGTLRLFVRRRSPEAC